MNAKLSKNKKKNQQKNPKTKQKTKQNKKIKTTKSQKTPVNKTPETYPLVTYKWDCTRSNKKINKNTNISMHYQF